jgi:SAM-dependent methyltransferase
MSTGHQAGLTSQEQFGKQASFYSQSSVHRGGESLKVVSEYAFGDRYRLAIDIATGTGFTAFEIAKFSEYVVATDFTPAMLSEAINICETRKITNVGFCLSAAELLPFGTESVDLVTCRTAPHHFKDLPKAVMEWHRTLEKGGTLIMVDTTSPEEKNAADWMNDVEVRRDPSHIKNLSPSQWVSILENEGFHIQETSLCSVPLEFEDWVIRSGTPLHQVTKLRNDFSHARQEIIDAFDIHRNEEGLLLFRWLAFVVKAVRPK